ncbi:MAG: LiaF-related protein [Actinomycetia bacterium]|nr:LiaF-related protein [Actinomycetes bacterium]
MRIIKRIIVGWVALTCVAMMAVVATRKLVRAHGTEDDDEFSIVAAGAEKDFQSRSIRLREGRILALMGGVELDLIDAELEQGATLDLTAVMGGIDVIVPMNWRVEILSKSILGGVNNLTDPDLGTDDAPILLVRAKSVMAGIEIHASEEA